METPAPETPANAEIPATDGATPPAETPTPTDGSTAAAPKKEAAAPAEAKAETIEEIRALMRQPENNDAFMQLRESDGYQGSGVELPKPPEPPAEEEPDEPTAEETAAAEAQAAEEKAAAEKAAADEAAKRKDPNRVRIKNFPEEDRAVLQRMAEKEGKLSFDQARAELVTEGKIKAAPAGEKKPDAPAPAGEPLAQQDAHIADLEKQIDDAATAFDTPKLAKLTVEHSKALAERNKLEARAEAAQVRQQAETHGKLAAAVADAEGYAVEQYPDAGKPGTPLYEAIEDLMDDAPPSAFNDPDYPLVFAAKAARKINYQPPARAAAVPAKPPVLPKKPARPVPPVASGASPGAAPTKVPSLEQRMADAEGDPAKLKSLLREAGTRSFE